MKQKLCPECGNMRDEDYFRYMFRVEDKCSYCRNPKPPHPNTIYVKRLPGRRKMDWRGRERVKAGQ